MSICCRERNSFRRYMDTYVMLLGNKKCGATCEKTLLDFSLLFWDTPPPPPHRASALQDKAAKHARQKKHRGRDE